MFVDQSTMAEGEAVDPEWWGYECKSGQILFYYNKTTGEHIWSGGDQVGGLLNITLLGILFSIRNLYSEIFIAEFFYCHIA